MQLFSAAERRFLDNAARLAYSNPFLPERIECERAILGKDFHASEAVWSVSVEDPDAKPHNVVRLEEKLERTLGGLPYRLAKASDVTPQDWAAYEEAVQLLLYQRYHPHFVSAASSRAPFFRAFAADWHEFFEIPGKRFETSAEPAHLFACFRQVQRAFHGIFENIIGSSMPAARLRASVWQSVFTHDMRRYRRVLYTRMGDFATLITGPSGTGKELVARAIAGSRYVPFDATRMEFADAPGERFFPINLAALSPALIESELFGHRRGSFTGAVADRKGFLEACPAAGSVFLDELGELDLSIQVKLLRVIETRRFSPVGEVAAREFYGKLIAATNRDLPREIRAGRFREDLYYRLCADLIRTPSLKDQLEDSPGILRDLLLYMLRRAVGAEAESCLDQVEDWITSNLPRDYDWPGNYRELEQCVRNIVIRRSYTPLAAAAARGGVSFMDRIMTGTLTADEVLAFYSALVYRQAGSYEEAARRLGLDRRTVKAKVDLWAARSERLQLPEVK
jgi:transcriptional regulator with AAA-type ATPase domain